MADLNIYLSGFLFTASVITFIIAVYSSYQKDVPAAKALACLCLASTIYSFGYGMELLNSKLEMTLYWNFFQYFGMEFLPVFWLMVAFQYCGMEKLLTRWVKILLFLFPIFFIIIRYTNPMHHLFFKNTYMVFNGYFNIMFIEKGPLYLLNAIFIICSVLSSNFLYLKFFIQSKGQFQYQSSIMLIASLAPLFAFVLLIFNVSPLDIDCIPFFSTFSYILLLFSLFKYKFLNLVPLAYEKVFESMKDGVIVLDHHFIILDFNYAAKEIFKELNTKSVGKKIDFVLGNAHNFVAMVLEGKEMQYEKKEDNKSNFYMVNISILDGKLKKTIGYIVSLNDISVQIENMNKLQFIATMDNLTQIYNRRAFLEACEEELLRSKYTKSPLSLIMLDLDHFKNINDCFGHQAGDIILKHVAKVCGGSIRSYDILGRFGGEEFMVFLPYTSIAEAFVIAERIRRNIEKLIVIYEGNHLKITSSFGISGIDEPRYATIDLLIKYADEALYQAKKNGRNCVEQVPVSIEK